MKEEQYLRVFVIGLASFMCNFLFGLSLFISSTFQNILSFSWQEIDKWKSDRLTFFWKMNIIINICHIAIVATFTKQVHFLENWNYIVCCTHPQSCLMPDPMHCSPSGSSIHRIFQARILERVAISY